MKKLLAIAIATAVTVPAMADTTLYGQLHASLDVLSADGASSVTSVASNSSRIGIKGSTELSNGLKAIYVAEWGMDTGGNDAPTKTTTFSERNQIIGVAGGFGAVMLGRHDTPFKMVGRKGDLFWSTQLGQNRSIVNAGAWDLRVNNVVAYQSPKIGGFQSLAAYVTDAGGTNDNTAFSINGIYNAGPLMVAGAYETHDFAGTSGEKALRLVGSYKFGAAKVVGFYQNETNNGAIAGNIDAVVYGIGAAYKVSPAGTIKGQYYTRDNTGTDVDPALLAVGYDHNLGKSTDVYVQYATISEGSTLGGAGHGESITATTTNGDAEGISVGIRHKF